MFVYPYKAGSKSAIALSQALPDGKLIRLKGSKFKPTKNKVVVNWGSQHMPEEYVTGCKWVINNPRILNRASNKLTFFQHMSTVEEELRPRIPPFTTDKAVAREWLAEPKGMVFARTVLNGHSAEGIVVVTNEEELATIPNGTLLVKYIMKRHEYRIHASARFGAFSVQQKLRNREVPDEQVNFKIRNHANGFIFARQNIEAPQDVIDQAVKAIVASGLDFGAVDVIYQERQAQAYVLEINSAPGLEGTTVTDYATMIQRLME